MRFRFAIVLLLALLCAVRVCAAQADVSPENTLAPEPEVSWQGKVAAIPIKGPIMGKPYSDMADEVKAALKKANEDKARRIVLEIDSPGGAVDACDELAREISESSVPVSALVLYKAVSGGAMLANAAQEIVMTKSARLGDIQPMRMSLTGDNTGMDDRTAEKIEVDIRTIMRVHAANNGRPTAVMEAMVSRSIALYKVTLTDGTAEFMTGHELEVLEDNIAKKRTERGIAGTEIIKPQGNLLELSAAQAVEYGVAAEVVDSAADFYAARGIADADIVRPDITAKEINIKDLIPSLDSLGLPGWVIVLLGVFLIAGVGGLVTEWHAPGSGVPAVIGIIGFVCFFSTLLMYDRGSPVGIVLFLVGIVLFAVEIMILPGFGLAGIAGLVAIFLGLLLAYMPAWDSEYMQTFMWREITTFLLLIFVGLAGIVFFAWFIGSWGHKIPLLGRVFHTKTQNETGTSSADPGARQMAAAESARLAASQRVGLRGMAYTMLRPAGKIRLDSGELLDALTNGEFIEVGTRVRIASADSGRIFVEKEMEVHG